MARKTPLRVWGIRIGIALLAGIVVGAIVGVIGVNTLDPGGRAASGTLESTIDSIATGKAQSPRAERAREVESPAPRVEPQTETTSTASRSETTDLTPVADSAANQLAEAKNMAAMLASQPRVNSIRPDSIRAAERVVPSINNVVIPDLVGLEEGAARGRLMSMGLRIGMSTFRASRRATGIVVATVPPAFAYVNPGGTVTLVLSNGRLPIDSMIAGSAATARPTLRAQNR